MPLDKAPRVVTSISLAEKEKEEKENYIGDIGYIYAENSELKDVKSHVY